MYISKMRLKNFRCFDGSTAFLLVLESTILSEITMQEKLQFLEQLNFEVRKDKGRMDNRGQE